MTLHYPGRAREFILGMGGYGSGKTTAILKTADMLHKTGSTAKLFVVVCGDNAWGRHIEAGYPHLAEMVEWVPVFDWEQAMQVLGTFEAKIKARMEPGQTVSEDWLVLDLLSPFWLMCQEHVNDKLYGQDVASFLLDAKAEGKDDRDVRDGWGYWGRTNATYRSFTTKLIRMSFSCHVYMTAYVDTLSNDEKQEVKLIFQSYGVKPRGQKESGVFPTTVLWFRSQRPGDYALTTIKDKEREPWTGQKLNNFPVDYLVKTAGWKLA